MPLIKCPECNQSISDQAENCPNCAYPISSTPLFKKFIMAAGFNAPNNQGEGTPFQVLSKKGYYVIVDLNSKDYRSKIKDLTADGFKKHPDLLIAKDEDEALNFLYISYTYWDVFGYIIGLLTTLSFISSASAGFALGAAINLFGIYTAYLTLNKNKHGFLAATLLTLNPIVWIINGFYLKNRWDHPLVNNKD